MKKSAAKTVAERKKTERTKMTAAGFVRSPDRWIHTDDKAKVLALIEKLNAIRGI